MVWRLTVLLLPSEFYFVHSFGFLLSNPSRMPSILLPSMHIKLKKKDSNRIHANVGMIKCYWILWIFHFVAAEKTKKIPDEETSKLEEKWSINIQKKHVCFSFSLRKLFCNEVLLESKKGILKGKQNVQTLLLYSEIAVKNYNCVTSALVQNSIKNIGAQKERKYPWLFFWARCISI